MASSYFIVDALHGGLYLTEFDPHRPVDSDV